MKPGVSHGSAFLLIGVTLLLFPTPDARSSGQGKFSLRHLQQDNTPVEVDFDRHRKAGVACEQCHHPADEERPDSRDIACRSCHDHDGGKVPGLAENVYHLNCIGCHKDLSHQGKRAGPARCDGCHRK